jgi:hypothetical protein
MRSKGVLIIMSEVDEVIKALKGSEYSSSLSEKSEMIRDNSTTDTSGGSSIQMRKKASKLVE